jgi:pSer/pThr/pTyr-binding forkhead associated (FHA) protein
MHNRNQCATLRIGSKGPARAIKEMIHMTLCITEDGRPARRIALENTLTIGRDTSNTIVLTTRTVSRCHAMMFHDSSGWLLADLESTNGTLVNGVLARRDEPVRLANGDIIQFGQAVARYVTPAACLVE